MSSDTEIWRIARLMNESSKSAGYYWREYCAHGSTEEGRKMSARLYRHHRAQCEAYAKALAVVASALQPYDAIERWEAAHR